MFACTLEYVDYMGAGLDEASPVFNRLLLPAVRIGAGHKSVRGKTLALLWQLALTAACSYQSLRTLLGRVLAITSDLGTEHRIAACPDLLPSFCRANSLPLPTDWQLQPRLFPMAVVSPGWGHICDGLLRRLLSSYTFFPLWLQRAKALCKLIREHNAELERKFKRLGFASCADAVKASKAPAFAHWRWSTLVKTARAVAMMRPILKEHWGSLDFLQGLRDKKIVKLVGDALRDPRFKKMTALVHYLAKQFTDLGSWGGSCSCHQEATAGEFTREPNGHSQPPGTMTTSAFGFRSEFSCSRFCCQNVA